MSTIQIEDLLTGSGDSADFWRTLRFHYVMSRPDGTVLDATGRSPFTFALLPDHHSWIRHLVGMRVGGRRRVHVPATRKPQRLLDQSPLYERDLVIEVHLVEIAPEPITVSVSERLLGEGPPAQWGDLVEVNYMFIPLEEYNPYPPTKDKHQGIWGAFFNAKTVHSTKRTDLPRVTVLGSGTLMAGLEDAIVGMQAGGRRMARLSPNVTEGVPLCVWIELVSCSRAPNVEA